MTGEDATVYCSSVSGYVARRLSEGHRPTRMPDVRLECGCGAKKWQRDKPGSPCAYCGREPEVAA